MAEEQDYKPTPSEQKKEDWMNSKWRPMMGWMYMLVCTMDFVGFPVLWSLLQMVSHGNVSSQWQPLTLQGAGLFHIAMGAVIGISAYGRTQEKLGGAAGPTMSFPQGAGTTYTPSAPVTSSFGGSSNGTTTGFASGASAFSAPSSGGFGATSGGFGSTPAPASGGFGGGSFGSTSTTTTAPTVTASGVGAPAPIAGAKPIGPAATAFPPI
jgi:hypothetical protein